MHDPVFPPYGSPVPMSPPPHEESRTSRRSIVGVALLSAALASVSTFGMITMLGDEPGATVPPPSNSSAEAAQAVAIDDSSDLSSVVARAKESVVTITAQGINRGGVNAFNIPATGVGSGIVVGANGLILTTTMWSKVRKR